MFNITSTYFSVYKNTSPTRLLAYITKGLLTCYSRSYQFHGNSRSSHQRCSVRKGVLRNFTKFTKKHLCQSRFFNKVAGLRPATLLKKSSQHRCFPVNFAEFLRTPFLQNTSGRLLFAIVTRSGQIIFRIFWKQIIIIFPSNMNIML